MHEATSSPDFAAAERRGQRRLPGLAVLAALLALLTACDATARLGGPQTGRSGGGQAGGSSTALIDPQLVGSWRRVLVFTGTSGDLVRSETIWTFRSDGSATRIVEVLDFGRGFADGFVSHARWEVVDGTVIIDFDPPLSTVLRLDYDVAFDGASTILGSDRYFRLH